MDASPHWMLAADAPLLARTTFRVPARAELLADLRHSAALPELLAQPWARGRPLTVLGEGSNLLVTRDLPGLVLSLQQRGIRVVGEDAEEVRVEACAGENWHELVTWSVARGLHGIENLAMIPGTVGAAPIQNIGAYGMELADALLSVQAWDLRRQCWQRLDRTACAFGYRDSLFKREPGRWIITAVELRLRRQAPLRLDYAGLREECAAIHEGEPTLPVLAEAICRLRTRKLPNPALIGNAGSFFKNPVVDAGKLTELRQRWPELPAWPQPDGQAKLSAAWLIEQAGWKGFRDGDAGISEQHALVLVNHGRASGAELLALARRVAEDVRARYGVKLEAEPRIL